MSLAARKAAYRLRWLVDWRLVATLAASGLVALLGFVVIDNSHGRHDALEALKAQARQSVDIREAQSRRIDILQEQIADLTSEIVALRDQVTAMGQTPVVDAPARPDFSERPSGRPSPTTTSTTKPSPGSPSPAPSTTTTTNPAPAPTCTTVPVLGRCV